MKPIKPFNDDTVMNRLVLFDEEYPENKSKKPFIISLLTIIVLLASSGVFFGYNYFSNSNERLFDKYFVSCDITYQRMPCRMQAIKKYQDGDFKKAVELFSILASKDSTMGSDHFYLAISYAKCGKYYNAIDLFHKITLDETNFYKINSSWYLGLCYLKVHENEKSREQFKLILEEGKQHSGDALAILKKLKN